MIRIYIPTLGRVGRQTTLNNLPEWMKEDAVLVAPPMEAHLHDHQTLTCPAKGIAATRQWIVEQHRVRKYGPLILMLDDDILFYRRRGDDQKKFENMRSPLDFRDMMDSLENAMYAGHAHAGIRHREMAQDADAFENNSRALRALAYNVNVLKKEDVRFDRLPVMEDFDVTLQLLRKGYPNVVMSRYIQNQGSSNAPGGCSTYRTMERQRKGALGLAKLHPQFVQVVEKQTKTAWNGQVRTDVRVAWKKAFASSQQEAA